MDAKPLVVIYGPTASGKTSLAIELAQKFHGEIICADSRSIYKDMDIGTAKPTPAEQALVPHWGLDLVEPGEYFSAADFKLYTLNKIDEIRGRGHVPFLVGGTGLYVDAVIFDYQFGPKSDTGKRELLEKMTIEQLHEYCNNYNITLPENKYNKRYVIRAIERNNDALLRRDTPISNTIIVGISTDRDVLRMRIGTRIEQLFDDGVVNEAKTLGDKYGWDNEAMTSNIYPLVHEYLLGHMTLSEIKEKAVTIDWRLAKRQLTWLRRNKFIKWLSLDEASKYLTDRLSNC
jgi:tRNA dimethylallyltransferase